MLPLFITAFFKKHIYHVNYELPVYLIISNIYNIPCLIFCLLTEYMQWSQLVQIEYLPIITTQHITKYIQWMSQEYLFFAHMQKLHLQYGPHCIRLVAWRPLKTAIILHMYCTKCHSSIWLYHIEIIAISHTI
jgi:hypothetical protein